MIVCRQDSKNVQRRLSNDSPITLDTGECVLPQRLRSISAVGVRDRPRPAPCFRTAVLSITKKIKNYCEGKKIQFSVFIKSEKKKQNVLSGLHT